MMNHSPIQLYSMQDFFQAAQFHAATNNLRLNKLTRISSPFALRTNLNNNRWRRVNLFPSLQNKSNDSPILAWRGRVFLLSL